MAWREILKDGSLDLTESQKKAAASSAESAIQVIRKQVRKAWIQLIVPVPDPNDQAKVIFDVTARRQEGGKTPAEHAWNIAAQEGHIAEKLGATTLSEKIAGLWPEGTNSLSVDRVRDWYFEYLHMERVRDETVIADAISDAAATLENPPFAIATGENEDKFEQLSLSQSVRISFNTGTLLVQPEIARKQSAADSGATAPVGEEIDGEEPATNASNFAELQRPKRYSAAISLDSTRGPLTVNQIFENVITELERASDSSIRIVLEVHAESPNGFPDDVIDVVKDNADTLKFDQSKFS